MVIHAQSAMAEDAAFAGETDDQLFFRTPFFVHFDGAAVDKIDAFDDLSFFEDQFPFFAAL